MIKITGLEIENPYRYRAYKIGSKPCYYIQNESYLTNDEGKTVKRIVQGNDWSSDGYSVVFTDNSETDISGNQAGLILHFEVEE